jgi:hypothetical protein
MHGSRNAGVTQAKETMQNQIQFQTAPEPLATYMVAVDRWSDGTPAPIHGH